MQCCYVRLKDLLIKGCGSCFHLESSSLNVRDKDSQSQQLPCPLIGELFNHLCVAMLHSSSAVQYVVAKKISGEAPFTKVFFCQFCNSAWVFAKLFTTKAFYYTVDHFNVLISNIIIIMTSCLIVSCTGIHAHHPIRSL